MLYVNQRKYLKYVLFNGTSNDMNLLAKSIQYHTSLHDICAADGFQLISTTNNKKNQKISMRENIMKNSNNMQNK